MSTDCTKICDVCKRDAEVVPYPWPLVVTDAGGAAQDVCSERCLLDLAVNLIENEAREQGHRIGRRHGAAETKKRWWQR